MGLPKDSGQTVRGGKSAERMMALAKQVWEKISVARRRIGDIEGNVAKATTDLDKVEECLDEVEGLVEELIQSASDA